MGTLVFLLYVNTFFFLVLFVLSGVVFDLKMKGSGTSTPLGEAQGRQRASTTFGYSGFLSRTLYLFVLVGLFVRGGV